MDPSPGPGPRSQVHVRPPEGSGHRAKTLIFLV